VNEVGQEFFSLLPRAFTSFQVPLDSSQIDSGLLVLSQDFSLEIDAWDLPYPLTFLPARVTCALFLYLKKVFFLEFSFLSHVATPPILLLAILQPPFL